MTDTTPQSSPDRLGVLVKETEAILHQRMDEDLRPLGLSVPQYACLVALVETPGISGSELARRAFVSRQSMNVLLQGLERRGLVERANIPGPHRERSTELTAAANTVLARARTAVAATATSMTSGLSDIDRAHLQHLLATCRDALLNVHPAKR